MAQIDISDELLGRLSSLCPDRPQNNAVLVNEVIEKYLAIQEWQLEDIRSGIADADAGKFVPDEQVKALLGKFKS